MWYNTATTEILGIQYPILQGPFGGNLSSVELVAAVSNAGGLGGYGAYTLSPQEIVGIDRQIRAATDKPYNINLWVSDTDAADGTVSDAQFEKAKQLFKPFFDEAGMPLPEKPAPFASRFQNQLQVILDIRPKVFSFMFGTLPPDVMERCRRLGIKTVGAATTLDEAARYTTLSRAFTGRLGRGLTSRIAGEMLGKEEAFLPFPLQTTFMAPLRKAALEQEKWDMILFWGGQIASILKHTRAKELMQSLIEETTAYFSKIC